MFKRAHNSQLTLKEPLSIGKLEEDRTWLWQHGSIKEFNDSHNDTTSKLRMPKKVSVGAEQNPMGPVP